MVNCPRLGLLIKQRLQESNIKLPENITDADRIKALSAFIMRFNSGNLYPGDEQRMAALSELIVKHKSSSAAELASRNCAYGN